MASQIVAQAALFVGLDDASVMDQVEIGIEDPQPDFGAVEKAVVNARENGAKLPQIGSASLSSERALHHRPGRDLLDRHGREILLEQHRCRVAGTGSHRVARGNCFPLCSPQ